MLPYPEAAGVAAEETRQPALGELLPQRRRFSAHPSSEDNAPASCWVEHVHEEICCALGHGHHRTAMYDQGITSYARNLAACPLTVGLIQLQLRRAPGEVTQRLLRQVVKDVHGSAAGQEYAAATSLWKRGVGAQRRAAGIAVCGRHGSGFGCTEGKTRGLSGRSAHAQQH